MELTSVGKAARPRILVRSRPRRCLSWQPMRELRHPVRELRHPGETMRSLSQPLVCDKSEELPQG